MESEKSSKHAIQKKNACLNLNKKESSEQEVVSGSECLEGDVFDGCLLVAPLDPFFTRILCAGILASLSSHSRLSQQAPGGKKKCL